jgi:hypothetical protein
VRLFARKSKEGGMRKENEKRERDLKNIKISVGMIILIIFSFVSFSGCAAGFLGFGNSMEWKEEVLLHDGSKIIVERFFHLGSKPTLESTERQALDETISFTLPGANKNITWKTDFRNSNPEPNCLNLLVLDIVKGTPYIATYPAGCIAYNKWNRPNPPYIFFKYDGKDWKRISLEEFPMEINKVNVIVGKPPAKLLKPFYTVEQVNLENHDIHTEEYKTILRTPIKIWCAEMITNGRGGWMDSSGFKKLPSYEACLNECKKVLFDMKYCPCDKLFKSNTQEK